MLHLPLPLRIAQKAIHQGRKVFHQPERQRRVLLKIGGQAAPYLVNALTEYQQGNRKHPTMQAQAESFSAQDIADIAAYLSSLK